MYVPPKCQFQSIKLHDVTFRQSSTLSRFLEPSDAKCQEKLEITDQRFDVETSCNACHVSVACCVQCTGQVVGQAALYDCPLLAVPYLSRLCG